MNVVIKSRGVYVPAWNDNRKLPEGEQVRVHWKVLSTAERQDLYQLEPSDDEKQPLKVVMPKNALFLAMTERVENLSASVDGAEVEITTGQQVCDTPGLGDLYSELYDFYAHLDAVDKKK